MPLVLLGPSHPFPELHSRDSIPQLHSPTSPPSPHLLPVEKHSGRTGFRMGFYQSFPEAAAAPASCCCPGASTWMAPECWDSGLSPYFPLLLIPSYSFPSFPFPSHPISHTESWHEGSGSMSKMGAHIPTPVQPQPSHPFVGFALAAPPGWIPIPFLLAARLLDPPWHRHGAVLNPAHGIGVGGFASAGDTRLRRGIPAG